MRRKAELRDEPILKITLVNSKPIIAGASFKLNCLLSNPTSRTYKGRKAQIERYCFSYIQRRYLPLSSPAGVHRQVDLPAAWNDLPPGANFKTTADFDAPLSPGSYELFCTWDLFSPDSDGDTLSGGAYSNMLSLEVIPAAAK